VEDAQQRMTENALTVMPALEGETGGLRGCDSLCAFFLAAAGLRGHGG